MKKLFSRLKRPLKWLCIIGIALLLLILSTDYLISKQGGKYVSKQLEVLPEANCALVLGTSKYVRNGQVNLFFKYRIEAAIELWKAGKVDYFIVSGDNSTKHYNEPRLMRQALMEAGVPGDRIFLDYAGFRTLDSVVRAKEIFGQQNLIIVSQKFHNERAVYLARKNDIDAWGYNARNVSRRYSIKTWMREYLARVKVFVDIATDKQPKFLGPKITIPEL